VATIELDVRGLEPPEPLERILTLLDALGVDDCLRVKIDRRPVPLFRILERNGYGHHEEPGIESLYEITIWAKPERA
jgi:uncharacterized protein (DUF2249 family)